MWLIFINSLAPGKFEWHFRYLIFQIISVIDGWGISCELALRWMSLDLTDDKSTLVQVMAWCRQATSHYLSQYWPRSLSQYGVTRPQWIKMSQCRDRIILVQHSLFKDINPGDAFSVEKHNANHKTYRIVAIRSTLPNGSTPIILYKYQIFLLSSLIEAPC